LGLIINKIGELLRKKPYQRAGIYFCHSEPLGVAIFLLLIISKKTNNQIAGFYTCFMFCD